MINTPGVSYGNYSGGNYADDIMLQQYLMSQGQGGQSYSPQAMAMMQNQNTGYPQASQNTKGDTYEKSSENNNGIILGGLATLGAAGAGYYKANPFDNGKFNKDIISGYNKSFIDDYKKTLTNDLTEKEFDKIRKTLGFSKEEIDIAQKIKDGTKISELSKEEQNALKKMCNGYLGGQKKNIEALADLYNEAVAKIDTNGIAKQVENKASKLDLSKLEENLNKYTSAKTELQGLSEKSTFNDLTQVIKNNSKAFGITETEPEAIERQAKMIAQRGRELLMKNVDSVVTDGQKAIKARQSCYNTKISEMFNPETKQFAKEATDGFKNLFRNFKLKQAGKWGLIAAGGAILLNWAFGGKKES